jgi:biopolymer transport protein TolR
MAAVSQRGGSRRRTINEINMVPFIDVMLVLLIIFMVSAPLITTGVVDLPSVGKSQQRADKVVEVIVAADESLRVKGFDGTEQPSSLKTFVAGVKQAQGGDPTAPVLISGDKAVKYDVVVRVMNELQKAGVQRVALSVKTTGN